LSPSDEAWRAEAEMEVVEDEDEADEPVEREHVQEVLMTADADGPNTEGTPQ
jgi:hypothetical protein